jgi:hypothetical protein
MVNGYPINWALPSGSKLQQHPLYIKYSSKTIATIIAELANLKTDLSGVTANSENVEIAAYLSWLVRTVNLAALG